MRFVSAVLHVVVCLSSLCVGSASRGFVAACNGQYADALSEGVGVSLLVAETTGALAASFMTIQL